MAPKSVTFRRHDHLVSVLFGDLLSHSYNITFSMFLDLVVLRFAPDLVIELVSRSSLELETCLMSANGEVSSTTCRGA